MYVRREAVLSSQIEGTQSSLQDVLAAEARILSPNHSHDVEEIFNYVRAMNYGLERLESLPVSVRLIREIHAELLSGTRGGKLTPGELRTSQNWIGPGGCTLAEATFIPPPPHAVPGALGDLEDFLHDDSHIPLLIKIGLAHAQFETIHPFLDGNGRVGRLLITFLLCEKQVLLKPVLYLSYYFKRHRQEYYEHLQNVRDRGRLGELAYLLPASISGVSQDYRVDNGTQSTYKGRLQERGHQMAKRRTFSPEFKAQIVLEVLTGAKSGAQICREHQIMDSVLYRWKQEFIERSPQLSTRGDRQSVLR